MFGFNSCIMDRLGYKVSRIAIWYVYSNHTMRSVCELMYVRTLTFA